MPTIVTSALLCAVIVALWVASHQQTFYVALGHKEASYQLRAVDGVLLVGRVMMDAADWRHHPGLSVGSDPSINGWLMWPQPTLLNRIGFGLVIDGSTRRAAPWDARVLMVPLWSLCLVPAIVVARAVIKKSSPIGLCPSCGYDLRATPDRCPECGALPAREVAA